jgi:hypothetical protein
MTAIRVARCAVTATPAREPDVCHTARLLVSGVASAALPYSARGDDGGRFEVDELGGERPGARVDPGGSRAAPRPYAHHPAANTGHGLDLLEALAGRWGALEGRLGRVAGPSATTGAS